ncbi:MAG TPA: hypothetical protein VFQ91_26505 [Bryobacteraceae bacterium]|nr:hypothetical protein [Bryobacteraceae bacterium]
MYRLLAALLSTSVLFAGALVPVEGLSPYLPPAGWEPNRGQIDSSVLFYSRGSSAISVTAQSLLLTPRAIRQTLIGSNPDPAVRFLDPLPGPANIYAGADRQKWVTGLTRYRTVQLSDVYPGIDAHFSVSEDSTPTIQFLVRPGADPARIQFDIPAAELLRQASDGSLAIYLTGSRIGTPFVYPAPSAEQGTQPRMVQFVTEGKRFGFQVSGQDASTPLTIRLSFLSTSGGPVTGGPSAVDGEGNTYRGMSVSDALGPSTVPCRLQLVAASPCLDAAIYKFSKSGELRYVTYLSGSLGEELNFLGLGPDGNLFAAGGTNSANFPTSAGALQTTYAGPAPQPVDLGPSDQTGDLFAARLDAATGTLTAATYLGSPNADTFVQAAIAADGSMHFFPRAIAAASTGMPTTSGALLRECTTPLPQERCREGYAARLTPALDRMLYGTYLPGTSLASASLHPDGSLLYAGSAGAGFPTTPSALQAAPAGNGDGIVARLDAAGTKLLAATYIGGADSDWILNATLAPDRTAWVSLQSFAQCCINVRYRLLHLDANLTRILAEQPIAVNDMRAAADGGVRLLTVGDIRTTNDAFLRSACGAYNAGYLRLTPAGAISFASYLPPVAWSDSFGTMSPGGRPMLTLRTGSAEVIEDRDPGVFAGCLTDSPSFQLTETVVPGGLVSIFGAGLGPQEGAAFQLVNNRVPTTLGGTRVLVNGEPAPILYASHNQINTILPHNLAVGELATVQVERNGASHSIPFLRGVGAAVTLFRADGSPQRPAAALNEDGSVNTPENPARPGARVVLFGSGGGATNPLGTIGEIFPLVAGPASAPARVRSADGQILSVEYLGAAPGLLTGVLQLNVVLPGAVPPLPDYLRTIFPQGNAIPLWVDSPGAPSPGGFVTVFVTAGPGTPPAPHGPTDSGSARWFSRTTAGVTP